MQQQLWCTDRTVCSCNWNHPPTTLLYANKYQVEIYHTVCLPHVQTPHIYRALPLVCSSTTEAAGPRSLSAQAVSIRSLHCQPVCQTRAAGPRLPSGFLGCSFGFPVGSCFDLGHLHICQGVRGKAWAHAFNGLLVSCPLLLQRTNHVLQLALPRQEVLHTHLKRLNLLPCSLKDTQTMNTRCNVKTFGWRPASREQGPSMRFALKALLILPPAKNFK